MWPAVKPNSAMSTPPLPGAHGRPWTPPDTDSDYFSDPFKAESTASDDFDNLWPLSPATPSIPLATSVRPKPTLSATDPYPAKASNASDSHEHPRFPSHDRVDSPSLSETSDSNNAQALGNIPQDAQTPTRIAMTSDSHARAHERHLDFLNTYTPLKSSRTPDPPPHNGMPRYPYTPDSARTTKKYTLPPPLSPLPPMPWDVKTASSPVQDALSSCISHLENLISTRQPNDDQMEYLVSKFEEMASYLSAPEAQSRQSDDYLFADLDIPSHPLGLGIVNANDSQKSNDMSVSQDYVLEVGKYIEGVKKSTEYLRMRMDEVKQLNSIQRDIITDLRAQLKSEEAVKQPEAVSSNSKQNPSSTKRVPPQRTGFWVALGEALDSVGDMLFEY